MTARPDPRQFDMFAALTPPPPPAPPKAPWEVAKDEAKDMFRRVVDAGLADGYSVGFGYHPRVPDAEALEGIWVTPTRLFRFPYRFKVADETRPNRIVVQHPLLVDHPHVQQLAAFTGWPVVEPIGSDGWGDHGQWHHAVDLVSRGDWQMLLDTRQFTTRGCILRAIAYGLDYGPHDGPGRGKSHLSTADARTILAEMSAEEPADASKAIIAATQFRENECDGKKQKVTHWPVAIGADVAAWARVHAIEAGLLKTSRSGFLDWTAKAKALAA